MSQIVQQCSNNAEEIFGVSVILFVSILAIWVVSTHDWEVTNACRDLNKLTEDADWS